MPIVTSAGGGTTQFLTQDQQDVEASLAWSPGTNTTVTQDGTHVHAGSFAVKAAVGATTTNARWFITNAATGIVAGNTYDLSAWVYCDTGAGTSVRFEVDWLTGAGALVSTTVGTNQTLTVGSFVQMVETGFHVAPATAAQARMIIKPAAPVANTNYWSDDHSFTLTTGVPIIMPSIFGSVS